MREDIIDQSQSDFDKVLEKRLIKTDVNQSSQTENTNQTNKD